MEPNSLGFPHPPSGAGGSRPGHDAKASRASSSAQPAQRALESYQELPHRQLQAAATPLKGAPILGRGEDAAQIADTIDGVTRQHASQANPQDLDRAQSFAALWYADRLGGAALQAQRESGDEGPSLLLGIAVECLQNDELCQQLGWSADERQVALERLQQWQRDALEGARWAHGLATIPQEALHGDDRDDLEGRFLEGRCGQWVDGVVERMQPSGKNRAQDVQAALRQVAQRAPRDIPLPFSLMTEQPYRHRILAVVRERRGPTAPSYQLELWNLGWGALPADTPGRIRPCSIFEFRDELSLARALVWLQSRQQQYETKFSYSDGLSTLAIASTGQREPRRDNCPDRSLTKAAEGKGVLTFPPAARDEEPQRSGSCVAKGLRALYQSSLGGSDAPGSRHVMALLDAVATSLLALDAYGPGAAHDPSAEKRALRRLLAELTTSRRHWKALQKADPLEQLLRTVALELTSRMERLAAASGEAHASPLKTVRAPAAVAPVARAPAAQPYDWAAPTDPTLLSERLVSETKNLLLEGRIDDAFSAFFRATYQGSFQGSLPILQLRTASDDQWRDCLRSKAALDVGTYEWIVMNQSLSLLQPLLPLQHLAPQLYKGLVASVERYLRALQTLTTLIPRPGTDRHRWADAERLWALLPVESSLLRQPLEDPTLLNARHLRQEAEQMCKEALQAWLRERAPRDLLPSTVLYASANLEEILQALNQVARWPQNLQPIGEALKGLSSPRVKSILTSWGQCRLDLDPFASRPDRTDLVSRTPLLIDGDPLYFRRPHGAQRAPWCQGASMETGGLGALLLASTARKEPFVWLCQLFLWSAPIGSDRPRQLQGNLLREGGYEAWERWLAVAQDSFSHGRTDAFEPNELAFLTEVVLAGVEEGVGADDRRLLEQWRQLLLSGVALYPDLAPSVLAVSLRLLPDPPSEEDLAPAHLLGDALPSIVGQVPRGNPILSVKARACQQWLALRQRAGLGDPLLPLLGIEFDLRTGQAVGQVAISSADRILRGQFEMPGYQHRPDPSTGATSLVFHAGARDQVRLLPDAQWPELVRVEWMGPHGTPQDALLLREGPSISLATVVPSWKRVIGDVYPVEPLPMPLNPGQFLWQGAAPPADWRSLRGPEGVQPSIFERAFLVEQHGQSLSRSILKPDTLQAIAAFKLDQNGPRVQLSDGEIIPCQAAYEWESLRAIGALLDPQSHEARAVLSDVWTRGLPLTGTITDQNNHLTLTLDNGWTVAPDRRHELPEWLQNLPGGRQSLAIPVVRGEERGLLLGSRHDPKKPDQSPEALILKVRPSGDIELDPESGPESVVFLLQHLESWAPPVARRLLQLLLDSDPPLSHEAEQTLQKTLEGMKQEGGLLLSGLASALATHRSHLLERQTQGHGLLKPPPAALLLRSDDLAEAKFPLQQAVVYPPMCPAVAPDDEAQWRVQRALAQMPPGALGSPEQLMSELSALVDRMRLRKEQASSLLEQTLGSLPPVDRAYLQAAAGKLLIPALIQLWFRCEQAHSFEPWRRAFPNLPASVAEGLQQALRAVVLETLNLQGAERSLALAESGSPQEQGLARAQLESLQRRLTQAIPAALLRQEWLQGLFGRPEQTKELAAWMQQSPTSRTLLEVRMGGGKTALLNPTMALEMAAQNRLQDPADPAPVFVVVPDSLEEDAKQLCFQQGWNLMGQSLPFLGSQASGSEVLAAARDAIAQGLPLTLTQSAWNFAWLESLRDARKEALAADEMRGEQAGPSAGAAHAGQHAGRLRVRNLARASVLLDEADEALALEQSYNLEVADRRALPQFLIRSARRLADFQQAAGGTLLSPLSERQRVDLLMSAAPADWSDEQKSQVAHALLSGGEIPPCSPDEERDLVGMALLIGPAAQTARTLQRNIDYGPSTDRDVDVVPYQSAFWPTDQSFSDPALTTLLVFEQALEPSFWTLKRAETLIPQLAKHCQELPEARRLLMAAGLPFDYMRQPQALLEALQHPGNGALRATLGEVLCGIAKGPAEVLRLQASGAPLRATRCVASTGTAPPPNHTPTTLLSDADRAAPARSQGEFAATSPGILALGEIRGFADLDEAIRHLHPHVLIDPCGTLDHDGAARAALTLSRTLHDQHPEQRPVALTWSAGTASSAPVLERILPDESILAAPAPAALERLSKVVVYQQAQCRGTDVRPRAGELGMLWVEEPLPLRTLKQAAGRLRGLRIQSDGQPLQQLQIVLSPQMQEQVRARIGRQPELSELEALCALCYDVETAEDRRALPELLRQDLQNLRQAVASWSLQTPAGRGPSAPEMQELVRAMAQSYHFPTLSEMVEQAAARGGPLNLKQDLLRQAADLERVLLRSGGEEPRQLLDELRRWQRRVQQTPDKILSTPQPQLAKAGVQRSVQAQIQEEVVAEAELTIQRLVQADRSRRGVRPDGEHLWAATTLRVHGDALQLEGSEQGRLTTAQTGISGFGPWWNEHLRQEDESLLPPHFAYSPAALSPIRTDEATVHLPIDEPLRLEPQLFHLWNGEEWRATLVAPPEIEQMAHDTPIDWRQAANEGRLWVTSLSGAPIEGPFGPDAGHAQSAAAFRVEHGWQRHMRATALDTVKIRALYGTPMEATNREELDELRTWLAEHPAWAEVWVGVSPKHLRAARAQWLGAIRIARHNPEAGVIAPAEAGVIAPAEAGAASAASAQTGRAASTQPSRTGQAREANGIGPSSPSPSRQPSPVDRGSQSTGGGGLLRWIGNGLATLWNGALDVLRWIGSLFRRL